VKQALTRSLFAHWNELRGTRDAPERSEIDPAAIRGVLPDTFILEIEERNRFRYRLAGTRLCAAFGDELRGREILDPWPVEDRAALSSLLWSVVDEGAGAVCGWRGITARGHTMAFEMLLLPLRLDGERTRRVLGCSVPCTEAFWLGTDPIETAELASLRIVWPDGTPGFLEGAAAGLAPPKAEAAAPPFRVGHLAVYQGGRP